MRESDYIMMLFPFPTFLANSVKYASLAFKLKAVILCQMLFNVLHKITFKVHKSSAGNAFYMYTPVTPAFFAHESVNRLVGFAIGKFKHEVFAAKSA